VGSSLRRDKALADPKPATPNGVIAAHHHVGIASLDESKRIADTIIAGGACGHGTGVGTPRTQANRHLPGCQVDDGHRNEERRHTVRTFFLQNFMVGFDGRQSADSRSDIDAHAMSRIWRDLQGRIVRGQLRSPHRKMDEKIHFLDFFFFNERRRIEVLDLAGDLRGVISGIKTSDPGNTGLSGAERFPRGLCPNAQRRNQTDPGHHHSSRNRCVHPGRAD
jgi:hypothetical protein